MKGNHRESKLSHLIFKYVSSVYLGGKVREREGEAETSSSDRYLTSACSLPIHMSSKSQKRLCQQIFISKSKHNLPLDQKHLRQIVSWVNETQQPLNGITFNVLKDISKLCDIFYDILILKLAIYLTFNNLNTAAKQMKPEFPQMKKQTCKHINLHEISTLRSASSFNSFLTTCSSLLLAYIHIQRYFLRIIVLRWALVQ